MQNKQGRSWAVIGGGMCGMTLALRLAEAGHQVTLFEASDRLGGLADAWQIGDLTWDRHYHVTLLSDQYTRAILQEIGLEQTLQWCVTRTGYFSGQQLVSMSNAWEYLRLPGLSLLQKMRLAWTIVYASRLKDWQRLESVSVEDWLTKLSGHKVFEKLWRPLLRAKLGDRYEDCSAAFIWATIQRLYAARESGLKTEKFGYVKGGYAQITAAFGERLRNLGVQIHCNASVADLCATKDGISVEICKQTRLQFDRAVATISPRRVAELCRGLQPQEQKRLKAVEFQGLICASLVLEQPLADFYLTYLMAPDLPFTAVIEMSSFVDRAEFGGRHLVYLPLYLPASDPRFGAPDDEIRRTFLAALKRIYPHFSEDQVLAFRVSRSAEVFPLPVLNFAQKVPSCATSIPGLSVVNAAQIVNGTLNVNETIRLAERSAAALIACDGLGVEVST
jgi:protoporphyrinogen oxidase